MFCSNQWMNAKKHVKQPSRKFSTKPSVADWEPICDCRPPTKAPQKAQEHEEFRARLWLVWMWSIAGTSKMTVPAGILYASMFLVFKQNNFHWEFLLLFCFCHENLTVARYKSAGFFGAWLPNAITYLLTCGRSVYFLIGLLLRKLCVEYNLVTNVQVK